MLLTFIITLGIGPQYGIFLSIGFSLLLVLFKSSRPGFAILGRLPGTAVYRSIIDHPEAICIPGIILFQFHSPIYFMNANYLKRKLIYTESLLSRHTKTEVIIVDSQAITTIDSVGLTAIKEIVDNYQENGPVICFASLTGRAEQALERAGYKQLIGEQNFFPRLHDAIHAALSGEIRRQQEPSTEPLPTTKKVELPSSSSTSFFGKIASVVKGKKEYGKEDDMSEDVTGDGGAGGVGLGGDMGPEASESSEKSSSEDSSESSQDQVALEAT